MTDDQTKRCPTCGEPPSRIPPKWGGHATGICPDHPKPQPPEGEQVRVGQLLESLQAAHQRIEEERNDKLAQVRAYESIIEGLNERTAKLQARIDSLTTALEMVIRSAEKWSVSGGHQLTRRRVLNQLRAALTPGDSGSEHQEGEDG